MTIRSLIKTIIKNRKILKSYKNDSLIGLWTDNKNVLLQFANPESNNIGTAVIIRGHK